MIDWFFDFVHRVMCFVAGHRVDHRVSVSLLWEHRYAELVICFRCGHVACPFIQDIP